MDLETKFRATKLWNHVVRSFRSELPLKKHRRQLRIYDQTFTGSEALDWLHNFLSHQAEFTGNGPVSREQAAALLTKFYQQGLFGLVREADKKSGVSGVKDDNTLYRFGIDSPSKLARTPLALKNDRLQRAVSMSQADCTPIRKFRAPVTPIRYRKLSVSPGFGRKLLDSLSEIQNKERNGENVAGKRIKLTDSQETLTAQSISSSQTTLTCNDEISDKAESVTPSSLPEIHLVARHLTQNEINEVWKNCAVERLKNLLRYDSDDFLQSLQITGADIHWNLEKNNSCGVVLLQDKIDSIPRWMFKAMRCLTRWPFENNQLGWPSYPGFERDVFKNVCQHFQRMPPLLSTDFSRFLSDIVTRLEFLDVQIWDSNVDQQPKFLLTSPLLSSSCESITKALADVEAGSPPGTKLLEEATVAEELPSTLTSDVHFETEFCDSEPVTRLLLPPRFGSALSRRSLNDKSTSASMINNPRSRSSYALSAIAEYGSPFQEYFPERKCINPQMVTPVRKPSFKRVKDDDLNMDLKEKPDENSFNLLPGLVKTPDFMQKVMMARMQNKQYKTPATTSTSNIAGFRGSLALPSTSKRPRQRSSWAMPSPWMHNGTQPAGDMTTCFTPGTTTTYNTVSGMINFFSETGRERTIEAVGICLLLLPIKTRHWLQYLLRYMNKTANNNCLKLDPTDATENRYMLLEELCWCIINAQSNLPLSQAVKLVTFLMDYEPELFKQTQKLKSNVQYQIDCLQKEKIAYTDDTNLQFCQPISEAEFDQQRSLSAQDRAMTDLLDQIVLDQNLDAKKKKRRLKQFRAEYPLIFANKFPDDSWKHLLIRRQSKRSLNNPLEKLKALRL